MRGGLARRAALLESLRRQAHSRGFPVLTLVGADEFLPDRTAPAPEKTGEVGPGAILRAYGRLGVDAGYLSAPAGAWLAPAHKAGVTAHKEAEFNFFDVFVPVSSTPEYRLLPVTLADDRRIDILLILFPPLPPGEITASASSLSDCVHKVLSCARTASILQTASGQGREGQEAAPAGGKGAQRQPALVIGLSPWGFRAELASLPRLEGVFHMVLGAGSGAPLVAEAPSSAPSVLWSRADVDGRSLIVLDLLRLPVNGSWDPVSSAWAREIAIQPPLPTDPLTEEILR